MNWFSQCFHVLEHYQSFISFTIDAGDIAENTDTVLLADLIRDLWQGNLHDRVLQRCPGLLELAMMVKLDFLCDLMRNRVEVWGPR